MVEEKAQMFRIRQWAAGPGLDVWANQQTHLLLVSIKILVRAGGTAVACVGTGGAYANAPCRGLDSPGPRASQPSPAAAASAKQRDWPSVERGNTVQVVGGARAE